MIPACFAVVVGIVLPACADAPEERPPAPLAANTAQRSGDQATREITIHFSRGEADAAVQRSVPADAPPLNAALRQLLAGPTQAERDAGIDSWFSSETADYLHSASIGEDGLAIVDFRDLRQVIPNASASAGSTRLLRELNTTVFELPEVERVEYRIDGNCDVFGDWLQYGCRRWSRPEDRALNSLPMQRYSSLKGGVVARTPIRPSFTR